MARVAKLQDVKVNLRDERGKEHTFRKQPLTFSKHKRIVEARDLGETKTNRVRQKRKETDMEKTIKAQKFAALVVLAAGCVFGITQYTNDPAIIVGGVVLVMLLLEKAK